MKDGWKAKKLGDREAAVFAGAARAGIIQPMPYPPPAVDDLPVVRYAPPPRFPGASHAVRQGRERAHPTGRVFYAAPLLAAGLILLFALGHRPRPVPLRAVSPPAVTRAVPTVPQEAPWDSDLNAAPRPGQFVRFFRMKATAYTPINTRLEGGRYTSTLRDGRAVHGVAVDPGLIPLGSQLWIPGYGHAVADDIGGAIKGHHVDIRVQVYGHMSRWGVRPVRVYVLQEPKEH